MSLSRLDFIVAEERGVWFSHHGAAPRGLSLGSQPLTSLGGRPAKNNTLPRLPPYRFPPARASNFERARFARESRPSRENARLVLPRWRRAAERPRRGGDRAANLHVTDCWGGGEERVQPRGVFGGCACVCVCLVGEGGSSSCARETSFRRRPVSKKMHVVNLSSAERTDGALVHTARLLRVVTGRKFCLFPCF